VFLSGEAPLGQFLLKAIDHTHCFTCGRPLSRAVARIATIRDGRVFGLFPEFGAFLDRGEVARAADDLRSVDRATVVRMVHAVPGEWDVDRAAREALVSLIVERARHVADTIEGRIWPQMQLGFDSTDMTEGRT
jgi:hypothetical protein